MNRAEKAGSARVSHAPRPPRLHLSSRSEARDDSAAAKDTDNGSLQRGPYKELLRRRIVLHSKHIGFAADLAVFDIALPASRGFIHGRGVPLSATRTLKTGFDWTILSLAARRGSISITFFKINCLVIAQRVHHFLPGADLSPFDPPDKENIVHPANIAARRCKRPWRWF